MTTDSDGKLGQILFEADTTEPEYRVSRRSVLSALSKSLPRRMSLAGAAVFAGIAARGATPALGHPGYGSPACCGLAKPDVGCQAVGSNSFACDHGGHATVWYCCDGPYTWMCGECQSGTGNCFSGGTYYCSYAALISQNNC
jgi:hypothetical protein